MAKGEKFVLPQYLEDGEPDYSFAEAVNIILNADDETYVEFKKLPVTEYCLINLQNLATLVRIREVHKLLPDNK